MVRPIRPALAHQHPMPAKIRCQFLNADTLAASDRQSDPNLAQKTRVVTDNNVRVFRLAQSLVD